MPPQGHYTKVKVVNIQSGPGALSGGTGTFNGTTLMSCGTFDRNDLPKIGEFYNITGENGGQTYEFPGYQCVNSGGTSDFQKV